MMGEASTGSQGASYIISGDKSKHVCFTSSDFEDVCKKLRMKQLFTTVGLTFPVSKYPLVKQSFYLFV